MPESTPSRTPPRKVSKPFNPISSLREHLLMVLIIFMSGSTVAVVAGAKKSSITYESHAVLNVMPTVPKILYSTEDSLRLRSYEDWMRTQINILSSHDILEGAIRQFEGKGFHWARPGESMNAAVTRLAAKLKIKQIRDTQLITLTMTSSARKGLSDIINAVVEGFIASKRTEQEKEDSNKLRRLREEKAKIQQDLDRSYQDLEKVSEIYGTTITEEKNLYVYINALSEMKKAQNDIYLKRIGLQNRMNALTEKASDIRGMNLSPIIEEKVETDVLLRDNLVQLSRREQEIRTHLVGLKPDNPDYAYYQEMLASLKEQARQIREATLSREERLVRENMLAENDLSVMNARSELQAVTVTETELTEKIKKLQQEVLEFNTAVLRASTKRQDIERLQVSLNRVNERMDQITLEWANPGRISVVSWALPPEGGDSNRLKLTLIGILASLVAGCGLAMGKDYLNPVIRRPDDIEKVLGFPPTGYIIESSADQVPSSEVYWVFKAWPESYMFDLYKNIVLRFKKEHRSHGSTVFTVLAVKDGNGASSFCINALAALDADRDRKLLIDLNYRNPLKTRLSVLEPLDGISEWAAQTGDIWPFIHALPEPPFDILPIGREASLLPTVLPLSRMEGLLETLRPRYDYVFIDGPPILASSFGAELASISDVAVLVPQADSSQWGELVFAATMLDRSGVQVVSVVPNRVPILKGGRFHESIERFYGDRQRPRARPETGKGKLLMTAAVKVWNRLPNLIPACKGGVGTKRGLRIVLVASGAALLLGVGLWFGVTRPARVENRVADRPLSPVSRDREVRHPVPDPSKGAAKVEEDRAPSVGAAPEVDQGPGPKTMGDKPIMHSSGTDPSKESTLTTPATPQEKEVQRPSSTPPSSAPPATPGKALSGARKIDLGRSVLRRKKDTGAYFLQVCSMKSETAAKEALAPFAAAGVSGIVDRVHLKGVGEVFRVLVGPFASRAAALKAQKEKDTAPGHQQPAGP